MLLQMHNATTENPGNRVLARPRAFAPKHLGLSVTATPATRACIGDGTVDGLYLYRRPRNE
jgi:hypothetical protein